MKCDRQRSRQSDDETLFETPKRISQDPSERSIVISRLELDRIKKAAHVWTAEEKEAALEIQRVEREMVKKAAAERMAKLHQADILRKKKQGLSRLEAEAREKSQYLVDRANEIRMEEEPEVKKFNALIRGAKCHAELDAQVQEKREIAAAEAEEDRRHDFMMEEDRRMALRAQEEMEEMRKQERLRGKMRIQEQIEERMEERRLKDEMKQQEKQKLLENLEKIKMEDLKAQTRRKEEQRRLHQEVLEMSEESQRAKERKKEEEKEADIRALENTCKKIVSMRMEKCDKSSIALCSQDNEMKERQIKRGKERELDQIRSSEQRGRERIEQEEQRLRSSQEAVESEWRWKEREQAKKKMEDREWWNSVRQEQASDKEKQMAIKASRERAEVQSEGLAQEKEREERRRQRAAQYLFGVRQQIREREVQATQQRRVDLQEHQRILEEALNRRARLNEIKARKLKELK
ncbi:hypothetical protein JZ751_002264 [Albula glossodonta]|uniref:Cilia- and flagella-associated protein 45 n=1 Tax=Albula glossodonta TaxID=121402 RepID=A0A8T2PGB3_9TELE|nr:hypothetical protein JZ751_002264 [Albula glossodonta]